MCQRCSTSHPPVPQEHLHLTIKSDGYDGTPDTACLQHRPSSPLDVGTYWVFHLPHWDCVKVGVLRSVRTATIAYLEYIVAFTTTTTPLLLLVPMEYAPTSPSIVTRGICALARTFRPWQLDFPWGHPISYGAVLAPTTLTSPTRPPSAEKTVGEKIIAERRAYSVDGQTPSLWVLHATDTRLAIGVRVTLVEYGYPNTPESQAKVVGIRTLERNWVEYALQISPEDRLVVGTSIIHLVVPLAHAHLAPYTWALYHLLKRLLPTMLEEMNTPQVTSLSAHYENEATAMTDDD